MNAHDIIKKRDAMAAVRSPWLNHWNDLSPLYTPFRRVNYIGIVDLQPTDQQFDSGPKQAANICGNGLQSMIYPRNSPFSEFAPPMQLKGQPGYDDAVRWCRECSEIHEAYQQNSNFWEESQDEMKILSVFGTSALFVGGYQDTKDELYYRKIPIGTYYIAENSKGYVDTLYRDLEYTADQAKEEYGEENLPEDIRAKLGKAEAATEKFKFIHAVEPRKEGGKRGSQKEKKPFVSLVVYEKTRKIVHRDGFDSFPYAVVRFEKSCGPWGIGPGTTAAGDARQLNKLNELADLATEISVFPPTLADADMEGAIDLGALGINYRPPGNSNPDALKQLPINNRLDQCNVRMEQKQGKIDDAFYVNMFLMLNRAAERPGDITAFQANAMLSESMTQFAPVYGRIISEGGDIIMRRNFESLLAAGKFPPPPQAMLDVSPDGTVQGLVEPSIIYKNRIVLAQQSQKNASIPLVLNLATQILTTNPELAPILFAGLEPAKMLRDAARNAGYPEEWLPTDAVLQERLAGIAQAQAQQREAALMQQGAKTLADASKAPPEALQGAAQVLNQ